jgi:DNA-binding XRE family transcriptional regulator
MDNPYKNIVNINYLCFGDLVNRFPMELWESLILGSLPTMVTPAQCRAARGLLGWNQQELARQAGVGIVTVHQLETGLTQPRRATLEVIRRALESAGVEFTNGDQPGVRLTKAAAAHSSKPVSGPKPTVAAKVGRSKTAKATEKRKR